MFHFKKRQAFQSFWSFSSFKICLSLWVLTFLRLSLGWHEAFATCWSSRLQQHWQGWDTETLVMLGAQPGDFWGGNPTQKNINSAMLKRRVWPGYFRHIHPVPSMYIHAAQLLWLALMQCLHVRWATLPFWWRTWKVLLFTTECFMLHRVAPHPMRMLMSAVLLLSNLWLQYELQKWLRKCHWAPLKYNFQLHPWIQLPRSSRICHLEFQPPCPKV